MFIIDYFYYRLEKLYKKKKQPEIFSTGYHLGVLLTFFFTPFIFACMLFLDLKAYWLFIFYFIILIPIGWKLFVRYEIKSNYDKMKTKYRKHPANKHIANWMLFIPIILSYFWLFGGIYVAVKLFA